MAKHLLIEIGCEELPPKSLNALSQSFTDAMAASFQQNELAFSSIHGFATPRRLAVIVKNLVEEQADREEVKLGPAVAAAFDKDGLPSKAAEGFARSNNTTVDALLRVPAEKGERLVYKALIKGKSASECIIENINKALDQLPIAKRMRWGSSRNEFVRPIKWIALVFGNDLIQAEILGVKTDKLSRGHRFMAPQHFSVNADNYETELRKHFVVADINKRKQLIQIQAEEQADAIGGIAQISDELLNEVTALVEWPVAITGRFDEHFLSVPPEALISSMAGHQKYFHIFNKDKQLLPNFITIANLESQDMAQVIEGNERVIRPRLSDAAFFYETDKKTTLAARCEKLKTIVFQKDLGSVFDKTQRVSKLAGIIANAIGADVEKAERAGQLCKSDLVSEMVVEFDDLQGLMGKYYALNDGENAEVASALYEQYLPTGAGNDLPSTPTGFALALADRIDTLIGIFGIGQQPTGNKDPFALRRAALGILNIIINKSLDVNLQYLYEQAFALHNPLPTDTVQKALDYTIERFRAYYQAQDMATEVFLAVSARNIVNPLDFDKRMQAVHQFSQLTVAADLASANKRVANILAKQQGLAANASVCKNLLVEAAEINLHNALDHLQPTIKHAIDNSDYNSVLNSLSTLKPVIDAFFDGVMVMVDDEALKQNRLAILTTLREAFLHVADISLLAAK